MAWGNVGVVTISCTVAPAESRGKAARALYEAAVLHPKQFCDSATADRVHSAVGLIDGCFAVPWEACQHVFAALEVLILNGRWRVFTPTILYNLFRGLHSLEDDPRCEACYKLCRTILVLAPLSEALLLLSQSYDMLRSFAQLRRHAGPLGTHRERKLELVQLAIDCLKQNDAPASQELVRHLSQ